MARNNFSKRRKDYNVKGRSTKKESRFGKREEKTEYANDRSVSGSNDFSFYNKYPSLISNAAKLPFAYAKGQRIDLLTDFPETLENPALGVSNGGFLSMPGALRLGVTAAMPAAASSNDVINIANDSMWSYIRSANSGARNYDATDLGLVMWGIAEVFSYIVWLQRVYGLSRSWDLYDKYQPDGIFKQMNIDRQSIALSQADFRYGINMLILQAASLAVPNDKEYYRRKAFLYKEIYTEGTSAADQLYYYDPNTFYKLTYNSETKAFELLNVVAPTRTMQTNHRIVASSTPATAQDLIEFGQSLLNGIFAEPDVTTICGDLIKAYGSNVVTLATMPEEYPIIPVFNIGVLEQMKNSTVIENVDPGSLTVSQQVLDQETKPYLKVIPMFVRPANTNYPTKADGNAVLRVYQALIGKRILTTTTQFTDEALVTESSRNMAICYNPAYTTNAGKDTLSMNIECCTEIISSCDFVVNQWLEQSPAAPITAVVNPGSYTVAHTLTLSSGEHSILGAHFMYDYFKFRPAQWHVGVFAGTEANEYVYEPYGLDIDIDNYTIIDQDNLKRLHEACFMSMLYSPLVSSAK